VVTLNSAGPRWRRSPRVEVLVETGFVSVRSEHGWVRMPETALRILDYFRHSHTLAEAVDALTDTPAGIEQWKRLTATLVNLTECGALVSESEADPPRRVSRGFGAPPVHIRMLDDVARTTAYLEAIRRTVRPDDVVVDLGTGVGVLAIAAAKAGARRVFAIERSEIADAAAIMFQANGVADRVELLRGWSTSLQLPERATLMVSEIIGVDPFEEHVAEFTNDAWQRLLTPDARVIPSRMRVHCVPVCVPDDQVARSVFRPESVARWSDRYAMDFSPLLRHPAEPAPLKVRPHDAQAIRRLADAVAIANIDFTQPLRGSVAFEGPAVMNQDGCLNGVLIYFDLALVAEVNLSTSPDTADTRNSWGHLVILFANAIEVRRGERVMLQVSRANGHFSALAHHDPSRH